MKQKKSKFILLTGLIILNLDVAYAQTNDSQKPDFDQQADALDKKAMDYIKSQPNQEELSKVWRGTQYAFGGTPILREVHNQADKEKSLADKAFQNGDYQNAKT